MTDLTAAARRGAVVPAGRATTAAWDLRVLRAAPFALVCTVVAAAGHAWVGGGEVAPDTLLLGFAVVAACAALLAGRERSLGAIAAALGAGQLGLHLLFHCLAGGLGGGLTGLPMAGMQMAGNSPSDGLTAVAGRLLCNDLPGDGLTVVPVDTTAEQVVSAAGLDPAAYTAVAAPHAGGWLGMTPGMLLGHLAAAVLAGWWLRRGEAALWRLLRAAALTAREWAEPLRTAVALTLALLLGGLGGRPGAPRRAGRAADWPLPVAVALRHSVLRRGPPRAAFAR
ncbi:hypothetical protein AB0K51_23160 [Kitasatospora sp. NPDC049285]|uniref:hypothetical protein n=1 Tax=Kitasatospora sp. NPDC049285 TaxID=3157096 RepID=UPI0034167505